MFYQVFNILCKVGQTLMIFRQANIVNNFESMNELKYLIVFLVKFRCPKSSKSICVEKIYMYAIKYI
jgi:hypothetical protein